MPGPELRSKGLRPDMFGIHSFRKGGGAYCSNGVVGVAPTNQSTINRGDWVQKGVASNVYFRQLEQGDSSVGRYLTGENVLDISFATHPPFFSSSTDKDQLNLNSTIEEVFPGAPSTLRPVLEHCLAASLFYHSDYLQRTLDTRARVSRGSASVILLIQLLVWGPGVMLMSPKEW